MNNIRMGGRRLLCLLFVYACIAGFAGVGKAPDVMGDGVEYILMTQAFISRGSVSLQESDVHEVLAVPGNAKVANFHQLIHPGILNHSPPFYRSESGRTYSYHFGLFSVVASPFVMVSRHLAMADTSGFLFANVFFVFLAVFCFFKFGGLGGVLSLVGTVVFLTAGVFYYLRWPHPEVFSASLLLISLVLLRRGFFKWSAFLLAFAAQQNPPIVLLIPIVFMLDLRGRVWQGGSRSAFEFLRSGVSWALIGMCAAASFAFWYFEFGVLNVISAKGFAFSDLISLHRLFSIYLDPNVGIVWVIPFALILSLALAALARKRSEGVSWGWVSLFLVMSIVCAVPSLSTVNWNSGAAIVSRYGVWCAIPVVFAVLEIFRGFHGRAFLLAMLAMAVCQAVLLASNGGATHRRGDQEFSLAAKFLLDKAPWLYFPVPQVFVERGQGSGGMASDKVYFWSSSGHVNKILFNRFARDFSMDICSHGNPRDYISSVKEVERGWVYWSLREGCPVQGSDGFHMTKSVPAVRAGMSLEMSSTIFYDGWSRDEITARWSLGRRSVLRFKPSEGVGGMTVSGLVFGSQRVSVLLNDDLLYSGEAPGDGVFRIDLSRAKVPDDGIFEVAFYWPDARPWDNADRRELAFSVRNISFN